MIKKSIIYFTMAVALVIGVSSCNSDDDPAIVPEAKITLLNGAEQTINGGETLKLTVRVQNAHNVTFSWDQEGKIVSTDSIYNFSSNATGTYPINISVKSDEKDTLIALKVTVLPALKLNPVTSMDDIINWTGEGDQKAALAIQWVSGSELLEPEQGNVHLLVWGYRWNKPAEPNGQQLIEEIAKADKRLFVLLGPGFYGPQLSIRGFGYDANGDGKFTIRNKETGTVYTASDFKDGVITLAKGGEPGDDFVSDDPADFWMGGWYKNYWSYYVADSENGLIPNTDNFRYSNVMAGGRRLENGCWDGWTFSPIDYSTMLNALVLSQWAVAAEPQH